MTKVAEETSGGAICDVGYSDEHWSKTTGECAKCGLKNARLLAEYGWVGSRYLHLNRKLRCYFEVSDEYLMYAEQVEPERYDRIIKHAEVILAKEEAAKDRTGRKCQTCGTTSGIGYYGIRYEGFNCFCQPCHKKWLLSPAYDKWLKDRHFI